MTSKLKLQHPAQFAHGGPADDADGRRDWAAGELRIAPDAQPSQLAAAFLSRMRDEDFLPPLATTQAFDLLRGGPTPPARPDPEAFLDHRESRLREQIAAFEQAFFSLTPDARQARHAQLSLHSAGFPRCEARLAALAGGMLVNIGRFGDEAPLLDQATHWCGILFLLPPRQRAMRRQSILNESSDEASKWQVAARALSQQAPEIVTLAPELIDALANRQARLERQVRIERKVVANADRQVLAELVPERPARDSGNNKAIGWVLFMVVMGMIKLISASSSHSTPTKYSPPVKMDFQKLLDEQRAEALSRFRDPLGIPNNGSAESALEIERQPVDTQPSEPFVPPPAPATSAPPATSVPPPPAPAHRAIEDTFRPPNFPAPRTGPSSGRTNKFHEEMQERLRKQHEASDQRMQENRQRMERHRQETQERMQRMRERASGR